MRILRFVESLDKKNYYEIELEDIENEMLSYIDDGDIEIVESYEIIKPITYHRSGRPDRDIPSSRHYMKLDISEKKIFENPVYSGESKVVTIKYLALKNRCRGNNLDIPGFVTSMLSHMFKRFLKYYSVNIYVNICYVDPYGDVMAKVDIVMQPNTNAGSR